MYIPNEMKVNRFKETRIPKKGEYFNTGRYNAIPQNYGGEEAVNVTGENKVDRCEGLMKEFDKMRENEDK